MYTTNILIKYYIIRLQNYWMHLDIAFNLNTQLTSLDYSEMSIRKVLPCENNMRKVTFCNVRKHPLQEPDIPQITLMSIVNLQAMHHV